MEVINSLMGWLFKQRIRQIEKFKSNPIEVQQDIFTNLVKTAKKTDFGVKFGFPSISSYSDFANQVPIHDYEQLSPYIEETMKGKQNVLWPSTINWFSKSSGTTGSRSKFIPVSQEALDDCHYKGGKDMISLRSEEHTSELQSRPH